MPLRTRLFIIISAIIAVILAVSIFALIKSKQRKAEETVKSETEQNALDYYSDTTPTEPPESAPDISTAVDNNQVTVVKRTEKELQQSAAKTVADAFVERYGSYSNENEYENVKAVQELVTDSLWLSISKNIKNKQNTQQFYGISTRVLSISFDSWATTSAKLTLGTLRKESKNGNTTEFDQDVVVNMIKSNTWLVEKVEFK